jgi:hypothetical protein
MNGPEKMNEEKVQVAYEILRYLIKNPGAQDTLEGIVDWWLLGRTTKHPVLLVKKALEMMVEDGLIIAHQGTDSRTIYKLYRRRRRKQFSAPR